MCVVEVKMISFIKGLLKAFNIFGSMADYQERVRPDKNISVSESFKAVGKCLNKGIEQYNKQKDK